MEFILIMLVVFISLRLLGFKIWVSWLEDVLIVEKTRGFGTHITVGFVKCAMKKW